MYYHPKDQKWFDNRKQAKAHYGISRFRKLLHIKEIIFTEPKSIANDELHDHSQINQRVSDGRK